jgi:hypothetical protein
MKIFAAEAQRTRGEMAEEQTNSLRHSLYSLRRRVGNYSLATLVI